jgi:tellurite resistance protein TehA-like permease
VPIIHRLTSCIPPGAGSVVMGTGIASVGLLLGGFETLSRVLLVIAAAAWLLLISMSVAAGLHSRDRIAREARNPSALASVAGTAVLGSRLTLVGWSWAGAALLVLALVLWLVLIGPVLTSLPRQAAGVALLVSVSATSLAVLAAALAARGDHGWLVEFSLAPLALGLVFYVVVMARFDWHQLITGPGDQWIAGGALAISSLALAMIALAARDVHVLGRALEPLKIASVGIWLLSVAWIPVLIAFEVLERRLGWDFRRWSTVFPVGMYAASGFTVASVAGSRPIRSFADVWVWVGVAVWASVCVATLRRLGTPGEGG